MNPEYIVVQAGGKGTRMKQLTANKPKALVPIGNRPMLFHLFEKYPDKKFIIIGDYKCDVLKKYLAAFAKVKYIVVDACGKSGTCGGLKKAVDLIPESNPFFLIWSDLVLPADFCFPKSDDDYVGLSKTFPCRWKYENDQFCEERSEEFGVAGAFIFRDKKSLAEVPEEGEFVKWLKESGKKFNTFALSKTKEYGLIKEWEKDNTVDDKIENRCRPFNKMKVDGDIIVKQAADKQGEELAEKEVAWYKKAKQFGFAAIPEIYDFNPLKMARIKGKNVFECELSDSQKKDVLKRIVDMLDELHSLEKVPADYFSIDNAYVKKTFDRLDKIRDLVPFADREYVIVNGRKCRNIFYIKDTVEELFSHYRCGEFAFIHGDNTFSNMLLDENYNPVLIDPRGYFGYTLFYGDPLYDWAKLYYSIEGNYDRFNLKQFTLLITDNEVLLDIKSNGWELLSDYYTELIKDKTDVKYLKLLHAIIWLSLTTYAWEDYDSICGAFYNGLYYLEEALNLWEV